MITPKYLQGLIAKRKPTDIESRILIATHKFLSKVEFSLENYGACIIDGVLYTRRNSIAFDGRLYKFGDRDVYKHVVLEDWA